MNPSVAIPIVIKPAMINGLRRPKRSINAPAKGCRNALTRPNMEINNPTRTVSGRGKEGEGKYATNNGNTMNRILFPTASPKRAVDRATTTRFPPIRSSFSNIMRLNSLSGYGSPAFLSGESIVQINDNPSCKCLTVTRFRGSARYNFYIDHENIPLRSWSWQKY